MKWKYILSQQEKNTEPYQEDTVSIYESDDETFIDTKDVIGAGIYDTARSFKSVTSPENTRVVLNTKNITTHSLEQIEQKNNFLITLYPHLKIRLAKFYDNDSNCIAYRFVLPYLGIELEKAAKKLKAKSDDTKIHFLISIINEIAKAHALQFVIVDIKQSNLLYDETTKTTYLIDGGYAAKVNEPIHSVFKVSTRWRLLLNRHEYDYIAPECWSLAERVRATFAMDIYSLGKLLSELAQVLEFNNIHPIYLSIKKCLKENPIQRISIENLQAEFNALLEPEISYDFFPSTSAKKILTENELDVLDNVLDNLKEIETDSEYDIENFDINTCISNLSTALGFVVLGFIFIYLFNKIEIYDFASNCDLNSNLNCDSSLDNSDFSGLGL